MESFGLGYEELRRVNPRIIAASMSACGRSGPWANLATFGPSLSALYGLKSLNGYPGEGFAGIVDDANELDPIAATYTMLAILAALYHRDRTGEGQFIELAQGEAGFAAVAEAVIELEWNGRELGPRGNTHRVLAPHGFYPTLGEDRWIAIACGSEEEWRALARTAGHEEWVARPEFSTAASRREARTTLDAAIRGWTRRHEAGELTVRLQTAGVAAMPMLDTLGIVADPHHAHRRRHAVLPPEFPAGELLDGSAWHLSEAPPVLRAPAPGIGEHNAEILGGMLGVSSEELRRLEAEGAIG
jgi:crotonobetainyl-CoA:carnitine CoA-transferase CaiB-like acyl-CoA transferase